MNNCKDCLHFHIDDPMAKPTSQVGECRFLPPKVFVIGGEEEDAMTTAFPLVAVDEFCGAWDDGERYGVEGGDDDPPLYKERRG